MDLRVIAKYTKLEQRALAATAIEKGVPQEVVSAYIVADVMRERARDVLARHAAGLPPDGAYNGAFTLSRKAANKRK